MSHYLTTTPCEHKIGDCDYDPDPAKNECNGFDPHEFTIECDEPEDAGCRWKCSGDCANWWVEYTAQLGHTCSECGLAMDPQLCGVISYFEDTGESLDEVLDYEKPKLGRHLLDVDYVEGYRISYPDDAVVPA